MLLRYSTLQLQVWKIVANHYRPADCSLGPEERSIGWHLINKAPCERELLYTFWKIIWHYCWPSNYFSNSAEIQVSISIRKEIQIKLFITALFVVATEVEITWRFRKRKCEINPRSHILWIISHLWKTHDSDLYSLTWKNVYTTLLNGLKRMKKKESKLLSNICNMISSPFFRFFKSKQDAKSSLYTHLSYMSAETGMDDTEYFLFLYFLTMFLFVVNTHNIQITI